ncbi:MAG TPA: methyltransferase domain-containing protein [Steroidobacteraceae bacterium]|nr:methyltransferase domain-containing protein [Steroidobacteraceae bacterium]
MDADADARFQLDRISLRRAFDRASGSYDNAAVLQTDVRDELLRRLDLVSMTPRVILDAGAGTGHASRALQRRYPRARVLALDLSAGMLRAALGRQWWRRRFARVCADCARLPLAAASVDMIFSNLMLPWCDPDAVLGEFRRVLRPQGLASLSSLGPDTLRELRLAWARADDGVHVHRFVDMHDLGDALVRAGFASPVLDVERRSVSYRDVQALMADLKATGAGSILAGRRKSLTGKGKMSAMRGAYEDFRCAGRLPATCEIVFAQAWGPAQSAQRGAQAATVALEEMKRQLRQRRLS